jgi:hypothetical protein
MARGAWFAAGMTTIDGSESKGLRDILADHSDEVSDLTHGSRLSFAPRGPKLGKNSASAFTATKPAAATAPAGHPTTPPAWAAPTSPYSPASTSTTDPPYAYRNSCRTSPTCSCPASSAYRSSGAPYTATGESSPAPDLARLRIASMPSPPLEQLTPDSSDPSGPAHTRGRPDNGAASSAPNRAFPAHVLTDPDRLKKWSR